MPPLSHITLLVRDLDRAERVVVGVLDGERVYDSGADHHSRAPERFYRVGGLWLVLMEGEPPPASYQHVAFRVEEAALPELRARVLAAGLEPLPDRPRIEGEGRSLYFVDQDHHLWELHAGTLEARLAAYASVRGEA